MKLGILIGSGHKIGLFTLPFLVIGIVLIMLKPAWFALGGSSVPMLVVSSILFIPGIVIWAWSVYLILTRIPKKELITSGPYMLMKHPLYTGVSLLVLPGIGLLCNSWLGIAIGVVVYIGSRFYAPEEERALAATFGDAWDEYSKRVVVPWI